VLYLDGTKKEISIGEIDDYVTERKNPKNIKKIREVHISYSSGLLKQGVTLVDTPGVGSVYQHNTEAAYAYLSNSDAAIFMISVDAPLSKNEIDYLKHIVKYVKKIFFVLNKVDIASPEDVVESLEYTRATLQEQLGQAEYDLVPISARQALVNRTGGGVTGIEAGGLISLEERLSNFIRKDKGRIILEASATRVLRTINELELELLLWQRAMDSTLQDLDQKAVLFTSELDKLEQEREDSIHLLYREVEQVCSIIEENINEYNTAKKSEILKILEEFYESELPDKPAKDLTSSLNLFIKELILGILNEKHNELKIKAKDHIKKIALRFFNRIEDVVDRTMSVSAEIFEIPAEKSVSKEYILGSKNFYFHFDKHVTIIPSVESITSLGILPKALIAGQILKNAKYKLIELFDRNCGRVRYDLVYNMKEGARDVAGEIRLRADAVSHGLRSSLEKALSEIDIEEEERLEKVAKWEKEYREIIIIKEDIKRFIDSI